MRLAKAFAIDGTRHQRPVLQLPGGREGGSSVRVSSDLAACSNTESELVCIVTCCPSPASRKPSSTS